MSVEFYLRYVKTGDNSNEEERVLKFNDTDSGIDILCHEECVVPPKTKKMINLGIKCQMIRKEKENTSNSAFWLLPRSSISKTPLMMSNSMGLIDSGYRGELKAVVYNTSNEPYKILKYTRLFQMANPMLSSFSSVQQVSVLETSQRGEGGFGSTGN